MTLHTDHVWRPAETVTQLIVNDCTHVWNRRTCTSCERVLFYSIPQTDERLVVSAHRWGLTIIGWAFGAHERLFDEILGRLTHECSREHSDRPGLIYEIEHRANLFVARARLN